MQSRSRSSSSVRCGCQYFQSTDLLPERLSLVGTPPLSRQDTMGDHDYEPINPKDPTSQPAVALEQSKPNVQFDLSHEETSAVEAEVTKKQEETKQQEPPNAQEPKQKEQPEPSQPPKLVTPSLAGLTALLAASPVLSSTASPEQIEPQEEEKKDEIVERKFIRIPNESAVIIPLHGDSDEEIHPERYLDPSLQGVQKIDGPVVEIVKPPPSQPPAQLQSVPHLQKPNLSELPAQPILSRQPPPPPPVSPSLDDDNQSVYEPIQKPEDIAMEAGQTTKTFQDRFKAGAGELRDKFRNISVPKISLPDRPHIKFPDHKNFKLPERPQFLKEKPQFLKERPQFLKEKPKFLTERPQFLKEKPKFLTEKPKFLKERPKFHLPERPQFKVPEKFKFERAKKADRPKVRKPNPSSLRRPLRDAITISSQSGSSHNLFEALKAKTYPRFLSKKKRDRERAAQLRAQTSLETESSLPSSPPDRRKVYPEKFRDIRFADEEPSYNEQKMEIQSDEDSGRHPVVFQDNYLRPSPYTEQEREERMKAKIDSSSDLMDSDKEQVSSGGSSMKHRVGVLEEIDSDEFFLRQKGLSREDVDVSRYLSKEIRDAFRSPKNTLALIGSPGSYEDYDDDDMDIDVEYIEDQTPRPPERRRSVKSNRSRDSDLNTFPARPLRMKQSGSESGSREIFEKVKKPPRKFPTKSDRRQGSVRSLDRSSRHSETLNETPRPPSRQKSSRSLTRSRPESETDVHGGSVRIEEARDASLTPVRPLRLSQSRGASIDERTSRGADSLPQDYGEYDRDEDEIDEDEDEIEVEEDYEQEITDPIAREHIQVFHTVQIEPTVLAKSSAVDDEEVPGYAVVRKPKPPRPPPPPKSRKEQLQSQLQSIKSQGINFFQTFPRRAMKSLNKPRLPVRPFRNYSTIGPVRPPRRNRVFREPVYVEGDPSGEQEPDGTESGVKELEDVRMENEEHRDLQSGEVLERMKGRPLPPPPRPPRKSKDDDSLSSFDNRFEVEVEEPISEVASVPDVISISEDIIVQSPRIYDLNSSAVVPTEDQPIQVSEVHAHPTIESSQQTSFEISDVNVSIQTDPLPENYIVEAEPVDTLSRSSIPTSTQSSQTETEKPSRKPDECDSRLQDRRRLFDPRVVEESEEAEEEGTPPPLPPRKIVQPLPELPPVQVSFPDKLHLTQLDVDKLNVNELQANIIKVSDIDSVTMQISEISSGTGNLILNNIELPADFIKNLVAQIPIPEPTPKIEEPVKASTPQPHLKRMFTPPPPIVVQHSPQSASEAPSPPVQQASTTEHLPKPKTPRTRRKSPMRLLDDSEDELASVIFVRERKERQRVEQEEALSAEPKIQKDIDKNVTKAEESSDISPTTSSAIPKSSSSPEPSTSTATAEDPSSLELMKQLLSIWYKNLVRGTTSFVGGINSIFPENEKRRDSQMAALLLVIIIATLILLGLGADHQVHHHHWDYLNPPR